MSGDAPTAELAKQWEPISEAQMRTLKNECQKEFFTNNPDGQVNVPVTVGTVPDSSLAVIDIYRHEIFQIAYGPLIGSITAVAPVEKALHMIALHANQKYPQLPFYCIVLRSSHWRDIRLERYLPVSNYLTARNATVDLFFKIKFIFIPVLLEPPWNYAVLLVISPHFRTVELLDSECCGAYNSLEEEFLVKILRLLSIHLEHRFVVNQWKVRRGAAFQQTFHRKETPIAVISNAMSIAFGYEISSWIIIFPRTDSNTVELEIFPRGYQIKAYRAAMDLLHSRFEHYNIQRGNENDPFVYRFGSHDYSKPIIAYRVAVNGHLSTLVKWTTNFGALSANIDVFNIAVRPHCKLPIHPVPGISQPEISVDLEKQRRLEAVWGTLVEGMGIKANINWEPEPRLE